MIAEGQRQTHSKTIVICSDGTGNHDIKARGTNVFKLYEAVDIHGHGHDGVPPRQIAIYDGGIGTAGPLPLRLFGSAFGWGFSANVCRLYRALIETYQPGDKVFLFGFSRGAYTVRALSGLIDCDELVDSRGLTNEQVTERIERRWKQLRERIFAPKWPNPRGNTDPDQGEKRPPIVTFLGVWDTVGAVGFPLVDLTHPRNRILRWVFRRIPWFGDSKPCDTVVRACQALALDDERTTFRPELWTQDASNPGRVTQVWFAGAHANVGGGYPRHGMSLVALDWMMQEAEKSGLRFIAAERESIRARRDVHDKLYDSRAGLGVYYRWQPRRTVALCQEQSMAIPIVHESVFERIALGTDGYAPLNIPLPCIVQWTRAGDAPSGTQTKYLDWDVETVASEPTPSQNRGFTTNWQGWLADHLLLQLSFGLMIAVAWHSHHPWSESWYVGLGSTGALVAAQFVSASLDRWLKRRFSTYREWRDSDDSQEDESQYRSLLEKSRSTVAAGKRSYRLVLYTTLVGIGVVPFLKPHATDIMLVAMTLILLGYVAWRSGASVDRRLGQLGKSFWQPRRKHLVRELFTQQWNDGSAVAAEPPGRSMRVTRGVEALADEAASQ